VTTPRRQGKAAVLVHLLTADEDDSAMRLLGVAESSLVENMMVVD
jgi:hypothetical protein